MVLLWSPAFGLLLGIGVAKLPKLPQAVLHLGACLVGHWLAIFLTSVVAFHINWVLILGGLRAAITGTVVAGTIPTSEVVFFFYLAFLCFFLGYFGSWLIYRAHLPWLVALVYCSILLVNLNYAKKDLTYLVIILAGTLIMLIARVQLVAQIQNWVTEGLYTDAIWMRSMVRRCMQVASVLTLLALLVSWLLPIQNQPANGKVFWNQLDNAWNNILSGHASLQNIGSLTQPYQEPSNFFSDQLTISGSVHLPMGEVLYYTSTGSQPRYLEGFTYDHFDGHTWTTSLVDTQSYYVNAAMPVDVDRSDTTQVTTDVTILQPPGGSIHYIFGPPQPISFDVPTTLSGDGTTGAWMQQSPLVKQEQYTVMSALTTSDTTVLSGVPLPSAAPDLWHNDKNYATLAMDYVQTPQDLSPNVQNVMRQWTQGATSAYDALKLLETHLSDQSVFAYSVNNAPIPGNTDVVDWLLKTRSGYCTYYATAMAVMARQLGIPTRIVNGFSQGHLDVAHNVWAVDGQDAHSWVQAYLPGFGWVNFDPTPGFAPNAAPASQAKPTATKTPANPAAPIKPTPAKTTTKNQTHTTPPPIKKPATSQHRKGQSVIVNQGVLMGISIFVLLLSLVVFLMAMASYWWRNLYAENGFIAAMFWRLCRLASWVGLAPRSSQTPYEYSSMLGNQFPQQAPSLWHLTQLFVYERWGPPRQKPFASEDEAKQHLASPLRSLFLRLLLRKVKK
jgi:cell division septation protein DedD